LCNLWKKSKDWWCYKLHSLFPKLQRTLNFSTMQCNQYMYNLSLIHLVIKWQHSFKELGMFRVASPTGNWFEIQMDSAKEKKIKVKKKTKRKVRTWIIKKWRRKEGKEGNDSFYMAWWVVSGEWWVWWVITWKRKEWVETQFQRIEWVISSPSNQK